MNKKIGCVLVFLLSLSLSFLIIPFSTKADFSSIYEDIEEQKRGVTKTNEEIAIDELLGPEENFPFLPENHRDNSNPIGRIGSISGES